MSSKHDPSDPEEWYRRGYHHGAWHLYRAVLPFLPTEVQKEVYQWISTDLPEWREQGQVNDSGLEGEIADATPAPRSRLNALKKLKP